MSLLRLPRIIVTSLAAGLLAVVNLLTRRGERHPIRLQIGDEAPDFTLAGSDGRMHRLRDSRGREIVVLAWFPKAFTGGCAVECGALGASSAAIQAEGARHYGISIDRPHTIQAFAAALGVDYPILSDPDGSVARAYGVLGRTGFPGRITFFIGTDGRILHIDRQVRPRQHGRDITDWLAGHRAPRP